MHATLCPGPSSRAILSAAQTMAVSPEESAALTAHFTSANRTTWFFVFFASLRLSFSYIWRSTTRSMAIAAFVVALVGVGMVLVTAERGGRLVFQYGLGVSPVPSSGPRWTMPNRLPTKIEGAAPRQGT